jgi:hypothetical protein
MNKPSFKLSSILFFALALSVTLITGCQRDLENPNPNPNPPGGGPTITPVNDNEMVTGGVNGIVVDEKNQPVAGAAVTSGTNSTVTDRYGAFRFRNISLSKANGTVKVVKAGYFNGYRTFVSVAGRINNVRLKLLPKTNAGTFSASGGGTINITGGGKLVMPAAAITDAGGTAYNGTVNVAMTWIDPSSADLPNTVMGDLRGVTTDGEERGLSTYGMLGVEMTGTGGQALKIATGKTAELTFPIPASLQGSAPATIDLWHFDEATARWKQEGTATKTGTNYIAQVSHFSFWNVDAPFPLVNLCMTLVNGDAQSLINVQVRIKRPNGSHGYGRTDSTGSLCGKVPKAEALVLEVLDQCYNVVYTQNIGPYSADASLGNVTVNIPTTNNLVITGTVTNCAGANVANGAAIVYISGGNQYTVPVTNGTFTLNIIRCGGGALTFSVLGIDYSTAQQGIPISGSGTTGTINVGTIQACGTSTAQFIELLIDGTAINFSTPPGDINFSDSTNTGGPYTNKTWISGFRQSAGTFTSVQFSFDNNAVAANGLPLNIVSVNGGTGFVSQQIVTASPTINITTFGPPAIGFVEGNFNIQMNFSGTTKTVACTFKVKRF